MLGVGCSCQIAAVAPQFRAVRLVMEIQISLDW